jgi:hypothetical protein
MKLYITSSTDGFRPHSPEGKEEYEIINEHTNKVIGTALGSNPQDAWEQAAYDGYYDFYIVDLIGNEYFESDIDFDVSASTAITAARKTTQGEIRAGIREGIYKPISDFPGGLNYDVISTSRGVYGLNGAVIQDRDTGEFYGIPARNTDLARYV